MVFLSINRYYFIGSLVLRLFPRPSNIKPLRYSILFKLYVDISSKNYEFVITVALRFFRLSFFLPFTALVAFTFVRDHPNNE